MNPCTEQIDDVGFFTYGQIIGKWYIYFQDDEMASKDERVIICSFDQSRLPSEKVVRMLLDALYFEYDTGSCELEDLL